MGNLRTPESVQKLQTALHTKAKEQAQAKFHQLYDKVYRADVLEYAWRISRNKNGAAGIDWQRCEDIEAYGEERWLRELAEKLRAKSYVPMPVRRQWIPKANGKKRPLGIPTVTDRVVQTAALLVLEPIFEADLQDEQYGFRPDRNGLQAVREIHHLLNAGHREVVDADLSGYFDSVAHRELMQCLTRRVIDRQMLKLIRMWLEVPVEEDDEGSGGRKLNLRNKIERKGTPQGAPISPLLSNIYMRRFVLGWKLKGLSERLGAKVVNYADDFVICCKRGGQEAMDAMRGMMQKLKLEVNDEKTHLCMIPKQEFVFLGYRFGLNRRRNGSWYVGNGPAKKSVRSITGRIRKICKATPTNSEPEELVRKLNRTVTGWANYFSLGATNRAYRAVTQHMTQGLGQWLRKKHHLQRGWKMRFQPQHLHEQYGLLNLNGRIRGFPTANV